MRDSAPPKVSSSVPGRDPGVRLIIAYKLLKGAGGMTLALTLIALLLLHATSPLEAIGARVHLHFTGAWSVQLSRVLLSAAEPHHLWYVAVALLFDATLTLTEGWALHHGHWWGPWLVVASTSTLVPFEIVALVRKMRTSRLLLLALNLLMVAYLIWRTRKDTKEKRARLPL